MVTLIKIMDETVMKMAWWNDCDSNRSTQANNDHIGRGILCLVSGGFKQLIKFLVKKDTACTFTKTSTTFILGIINYECYDLIINTKDKIYFLLELILKVIHLTSISLLCVLQLLVMSCIPHSIDPGPCSFFPFFLFSF